MDVNGIVDLVVERVGDCYENHKLCCSESVMVVLNRAFTGGLNDLTALQMGAGFCQGLGGAGCSCGGLTGAVAIVSLLIGPHQKKGLVKKEFRAIVKGLHDEFCQKFGSTCCRVLLEKIKHDKEAVKRNCLMLTKGGAALAATKLLVARPDLLDIADMDFLYGRTHPVESYSPSSSA